MPYYVGSGYVTSDVKCYPLDSAGPTIASGASAWAYGSWVEIVPANTITVDFSLLEVTCFIDPAAALDTRHSAVLEVGVGASGSESVIIQIPFDYFIDTAAGHCMEQVIPVFPARKIAANSRVAFRIADSVGSARTYGGCKVTYAEQLDTYSDEKMRSYPALSAGPQPVSSATAWTFGSWLELVPANAIISDFDILAVSFLFPPAGLTKDVRYQAVIQLGVGGAGSETPIISLPITFLSDTLVDHVPEKQIYSLPIPRRISANSRVAVRVANSDSVALTFGPISIRYIGQIPLTFGKTNIGGTEDSPYVWNSKIACRFQAPENGTITSLKFYGRHDTTGGQTVYLCVYSDDAGAPNALLGSGTATLNATAGWIEVTGLSISITAGSYYWLALNFGSYNAYYYYDTGVANQFIYGADQSDEPPPAATFGSGTYQAREMSIYATYTSGAQTYTKNYTADILLKKLDVPKTYASDVLLKKPDIPKTYTADLLLVLVQTKTYSADTLLKKVDATKTYSADTLLQRQGITKTYLTDVLLLKELTKTYSTDLLLKKPDITKTYTADVILGVGAVTYTKNYYADILLKKLDIIKTYLADILLQKTTLKTYSADVLLLKTIPKTYSADVLLKKSNLTKTYNADILLKKPDLTKTYLVDVLLLKSISKTYFVDALLKKSDITKTYTADVIIGEVVPWKGLFGELEIKHSEAEMSVLSPLGKLEVKHPNGEMKIIKRGD